MNPYEPPSVAKGNDPIGTCSTDPESPPNTRIVLLCALGIIFATFLANFYMIYEAQTGDGWGGMMILIIYLPIVNVTIMLVSMFLKFIVKIQANGASTYYYEQACIGAPLLAMIISGIIMRIR